MSECLPAILFSGPALRSSAEAHSKPLSKGLPAPPLGVQVHSAMGVCFQTRGRFQQGSGKIDWARRPGCAKVISNGITKAPDLLQCSRPLTRQLNSISEGNAFSGLKTDPHGAKALPTSGYGGQGIMAYFRKISINIMGAANCQ